MSNMSNLVMAFLGGAVVGGFLTAVGMKKMGYLKTDLRFSEENAPSKINGPSDPPSPGRDRPSYQDKKTVNTHKTNYASPFVKPDLEEVSKRYQNEDFDKEMAAHEYPEEDEPDEEDADAEDDEEAEIGEASSYHFSPDDLEMEEIDGYGHVICELTSKQRDMLIYLVHENYSGEIYPLEVLTYYEKDNVLCDINDAIVDDPDRIIGDALDNFGACGTDPDTVYVRNCSMSLEYEITRIDGYYAAKIYGVTDEEIEATGIKKPTKKRKKRLKEDDEE